MYQRQLPAVPALTSLPATVTPKRFTSSSTALAAVVSLAIVFAALTLLRVSGWFTSFDLRVVARIVPVRYHPHLLSLLHPLVHLGDTVVVAGVVSLVALGLRLRGYRRTWATYCALLSWPAELAIKAILPQPAGLGRVQATVSITSLVHGPGSKSVIVWLGHAAPDSVTELLRQIGLTTVSLTSSYPSGTAARGAFVLGILIWVALRLNIPVVSEFMALGIVGVLLVLGLATVLFAWHWPSDVLGGYALGLLLLAGTLALLRRPVRGPSGPPGRAPAPRVHGRLRWVPQ